MQLNYKFVYFILDRIRNIGELFWKDKIYLFAVFWANQRLWWFQQKTIRTASSTLGLTALTISSSFPFRCNFWIHYLKKWWIYGRWVAAAGSLLGESWLLTFRALLLPGRAPVWEIHRHFRPGPGHPPLPATMNNPLYKWFLKVL